MRQRKGYEMRILVSVQFVVSFLCKFIVIVVFSSSSISFIAFSSLSHSLNYRVCLSFPSCSFFCHFRIVCLPAAKWIFVLFALHTKFKYIQLVICSVPWWCDMHAMHIVYVSFWSPKISFTCFFNFFFPNIFHDFYVQG